LLVLLVLFPARIDPSFRSLCVFQKKVYVSYVKLCAKVLTSVSRSEFMDLVCNLECASPLLPSLRFAFDSN